MCFSVRGKYPYLKQAWIKDSNRVSITSESIALSLLKENELSAEYWTVGALNMTFNKLIRTLYLVFRLNVVVLTLLRRYKNMYDPAGTKIAK